MSDRQIPKWADFKPLLRVKPIERGRTTRQLAAALTIGDLRTIAKRRVPLGVFEYTDGAAESEISLRRARQLFRDVQFNPSILRNVADVDTTVSLLGRDAAVPFAFAPTGYSRMMHHDGERAVVRVAQSRGIPYALSTMGTTTIEDVAATEVAAAKSSIPALATST